MRKKNQLNKTQTEKINNKNRFLNILLELNSKKKAHSTHSYTKLNQFTNREINSHHLYHPSKNNNNWLAN